MKKFLIVAGGCAVALLLVGIAAGVFLVQRLTSSPTPTPSASGPGRRTGYLPLRSPAAARSAVLPDDGLAGRGGLRHRHDLRPSPPPRPRFPAPSAGG